MRRISNPPVPRRSTSSPTTDKPRPLSMAAVANVFLKLRPQSQQKAHHILGSSGEPQTHPCVSHPSNKSSPFELVETWLCQDAVEPATLLRATREKLLHHANEWGANALVDEKWQYTIRRRRRRSESAPAIYRVEVSYTACPAVCMVADPHLPVALNNVSNVANCMTILERNPTL